MLEELGFKNTQVYIHTGNWIFESSLNPEALRLKIMTAITKKYGWEVPVVVLSVTSFQQIFEGCPFSLEKKEKSYFTVLAETPTKENSAEFSKISFPEEEFYLREDCIYSYSTISAARVKMNTNFIERKLKVSATSRNFNTMLKIITMANA